MLGMLQIMIWLLCVYLVFKGVEIFQIAWMSPRETQRKGGIVLGLIMVGVAVVAAIAFIAMEEMMAYQVGESQRSLPNFNFNR